MSGSGKGLLGLWLYRSGEQEWALKEGSPLHKRQDFVVITEKYFMAWQLTISNNFIIGVITMINDHLYI